MVLDQTQNFVRVGVSGTHSSTDTTISVNNASKLPDPSSGKYNVVWWDDKAYSLPDDDPNVEIIRVTGRDTNNDTIIATRGKENTSATSKDNTDGDYQIMLAPTAKMFDDIETAQISIEGNSVTLGGSTAINHNDLSSISSDDHHSKYTDSNAQSALENTSPSFSDVSVSDFTWSQDGDDLVLSDGTVELIRQPKGGSTEFLQGIDAGPVEAPTDTLSQIINTPVTSSLTSGGVVGYNFSVNSQKIVGVEADADGSGGITNKRMDVDGDVNISGEFVEDSNAL